MITEGVFELCFELGQRSYKCLRYKLATKPTKLSTSGGGDDEVFVLDGGCRWGHMANCQLRNLSLKGFLMSSEHSGDGAPFLISRPLPCSGMAANNCPLQFVRHHLLSVFLCVSDNLIRESYYCVYVFFTV